MKLEALTPSQYRNYVNGRKNANYGSILDKVFNKFKEYQDRRGERLYIPLTSDGKQITAPNEISNAVSNAGYDIEDYRSGLAVSRDGKRRIRIGKILSNDPELKKMYDNDPNRQGAKNSEYFVVISKHPYDVAGMSTDRGWTSCMNLVDGSNSSYVMADIENGTLIAYLINTDDKNINKPLGRLLIKPFINRDDAADILWYPETNVYGTSVPGFVDKVYAWCNTAFEYEKKHGEVFCANNDLYNDRSSGEIRLIKDVKDSTDKKEVELVAKAILDYHTELNVQEYNDKLFVNVAADIELKDTVTGTIPVRFGVLQGSTFSMSESNIKSLEGMPLRIVSDGVSDFSFNMSHTQIESLKYFTKTFEGFDEIGFLMYNCANLKSVDRLNACNFNGAGIKLVTSQTNIFETDILSVKQNFSRIHVMYDNTTGDIVLPFNMVGDASITISYCYMDSLSINCTGEDIHVKVSSCPKLQSIPKISPSVTRLTVIMHNGKKPEIDPNYKGIVDILSDY